MMKKIILALFLVLFHLTDLYSQSGNAVIYGSIVDASTKQPLIGANVLIIGTNTGAATDQNGEYRIDNLTAGIYQLKVSMIGHITTIKTDANVVIGKPTQVNVELIPTAIELEDVKVTSGYFNKSPIDVNSTRSFNYEEIRRSPGGFEDVIRALSILPGVAQADAGRNDLIVRGGAPSENLYLVDGIQVQNINHFGTQGAAGGPLSYINLDFVDETSFSTGGFSALNGDKLSSVLKIKLRDGRNDRIGGKATISASQFGLDIEGPVSEKSTFIFSARRSYLDFIFKAADFAFVPEYYDAFAKADFNLDERNSFSFLLISAFDNVKYFNDTEDQRFDNSTVLGSDQVQYVTGITYRHLFNNGFFNIILSRNYVDYDTRQRDSLLNPIFLNKSKEKENSIQAELTYLFAPRFELTFGGTAKLINFSSDVKLPTFVTTFGDSLPITNANVNSNYSKLAFFTNLNFLFFEKLNTNAGFRFDYFNPLKTDTYLSPRISLSYPLTRLTSINFSTGIYYQTPSYIWLVGDESNKNLKDIRVNQFVAGVDQYLSADALLKVEGFYKDYSNYPTSKIRTYLILANTGAGFAGSNENFASFALEPLTSEGTGSTKGLEVSIQKKLSETPYYGILSLTYSVANFIPLDKIERAGSYDQRWILNLSGGYLFNQEWEGSLKFRYSSGKPYTPFNNDGTQSIADYNSLRFQSNHSLDIRVDKKWFFSKWTLITYIDIQNIYNRKNISSINWDVRKMAPEKNESIGILPSVGISAVF